MEEINETTSGGLKKVVLIGPECTGKTTLASLLAKYYNTEWVPEYARYFIDRLDRPYVEKDLLKIARGQIQNENNKAKSANRLLICDTDLIVIKIWAEHKFGACYQEILDAISNRHYDLYLLTHVDVPWKEDPQRENPQLRQFFFDIFKKELEDRNLNFVEIKGEPYNRQKIAVNAIDALLAE